MDETRGAIFAAALALPEQERLALAQQLLESLSPAADELREDVLAAELGRRDAEVEGGTASLIRRADLRTEE